MNARNPAHDLVGRTIASQFRIGRKLGAGGMGAVYLADQLDMDRTVVLKVLHPELSAGSPTAVERFKREGRAVARLNHPHIVQVYVFGQIEEGGQLYLAMEFIDGHTLTQIMADGRPMPVARVLRIADQILAALIEAHGSGLVHRDLKPDNIMLTDRHGSPDYVKVLDFGIAKMVEDRAGTVTEAGSIFGTPRYMSPEQGRGDAVDGRTDLYSLGVLLYELLCAHHPFEARSTLDYLLKHQVEPPPPLAARYPELNIPPRVEALVSTCLQKDPDARYASAAEARRVVHAALADLPSGVRPWPTPEPKGSGPAPSAPTRPGLPAERDPRARRAWVVPVAVMGGFGATLLGLWAVGGGPEGALDAGPPAIDGGRGAAPDAGAASADAGGTKVPTGPASRPGSAPASQPGSTPASQPASQPGRTPASQPASQPGSTPASQPGGTPASQPTSVPASLAAADAGVEGAPVPTSTLTAGRTFEGISLPAGAKMQIDSAAILTLFVEAQPREVVDFFHAQMVSRGFSGIQRERMRLVVADAKAPFEQIFAMAQPHGTLVSLTRNAERVEGAQRVTGPIFGAQVFPEAKLLSRTADTLVYTVRADIQKVFDFHASTFGGVAGVLISRSDRTPPAMTLSASEAKTEWFAISIMPDATGPTGAVMVMVTRRRE